VPRNEKAGRNNFRIRIDYKSMLGEAEGAPQREDGRKEKVWAKAERNVREKDQEPLLRMKKSLVRRGHAGKGNSGVGI